MAKAQCCLCIDLESISSLSLPFCSILSLDNGNLDAGTLAHAMLYLSISLCFLCSFLMVWTVPMQYFLHWDSYSKFCIINKGLHYSDSHCTNQFKVQQIHSRKEDKLGIRKFIEDTKLFRIIKTKINYKELQNNLIIISRKWQI